jgi:hypothetical protein
MGRCGLAVTLVLLVLAVALISPAAASARSSYCIQSGDFCYGTYINKHGKRAFELRTLGFPSISIDVCVTRRSEVCRQRRTSRERGTSVILWNKFPYQGHGAYRVRWYDLTDGGNAMGPAVTF